MVRVNDDSWALYVFLCDNARGRAAAGTRVPVLPAATRVPEQKQITANVLDINAIFNRIYGIRISNYQILTHHQ